MPALYFILSIAGYNYIYIYSYSLCSRENNLIHFLQQDFKTRLIKNSSFPPVEPSSRVTLRNQSIFVQTLHQFSIFTIQYLSYFRELYLGKNLWPPVPKWRMVYFTGLFHCFAAVDFEELTLLF